MFADVSVGVAFDEADAVERCVVGVLLLMILAATAVAAFVFDKLGFITVVTIVDVCVGCFGVGVLVCDRVDAVGIAVVNAFEGFFDVFEAS